MSHLKVREKPELVRDRNSKAILNTDAQALYKYREEREFKQKLMHVVERQDEIDNELKSIKALLLQLVERK